MLIFLDGFAFSLLSHSSIVVDADAGDAVEEGVSQNTLSDNEFGSEHDVDSFINDEVDENNEPIE